MVCLIAADRAGMEGSRRARGFGMGPGPSWRVSGYAGNQEIGCLYLRYAFHALFPNTAALISQLRSRPVAGSANEVRESSLLGKRGGASSIVDSDRALQNEKGQNNREA
jgi:hypothetical protein